MNAYICTVCGFLYDDESANIGPDGKVLAFEKLNTDWTCPICGTEPDLFRKTESERTHDRSNSERQS